VGRGFLASLEMIGAEMAVNDRRYGQEMANNVRRYVAG
jgi:hypothetical protein